MNSQRILVLHRDPRVIGKVKLELESSGGCQVLGEHQARNAVSAARVFRPNIILLDVLMPGVDGDEVAALIQADPLLRDTSIIPLAQSVFQRVNARPRKVLRSRGVSLQACGRQEPDQAHQAHPLPTVYLRGRTRSPRV